MKNVCLYVCTTLPTHTHTHIHICDVRTYVGSETIEDIHTISIQSFFSQRKNAKGIFHMIITAFLFFFSLSLSLSFSLSFSLPMKVRCSLQSLYAMAEKISRSKKRILLFLFRIARGERKKKNIYVKKNERRRLKKVDGCFFSLFFFFFFFLFLIFSSSHSSSLFFHLRQRRKKGGIKISPFF